MRRLLSSASSASWPTFAKEGADGDKISLVESLANSASSRSLASTRSAASRLSAFTRSAASCLSASTRSAANRAASRFSASSRSAANSAAKNRASRPSLRVEKTRFEQSKANDFTSIFVVGGRTGVSLTAAPRSPLAGRTNSRYKTQLLNFSLNPERFRFWSNHTS